MNLVEDCQLEVGLVVRDHLIQLLIAGIMDIFYDGPLLGHEYEVDMAEYEVDEVEEGPVETHITILDCVELGGEQSTLLEDLNAIDTFLDLLPHKLFGVAIAAAL